MSRTGQRGVALLSVLLVTSLVLLVVGGLLRSHRLTLQGTARQLHQLHLRQAALVAENQAAQWLQEIDPQHGRTLHPGQDWARQPGHFQLPDLKVRLTIEDLGGRFNLSRLAVPEQTDDISAKRWSRLLASLDIPAFDLSALNGAVLTDAAQLQLIPSLQGEHLQRLLPWVAVLPRQAALNINTAPEQVLASLENMTPAAARAVVSQRPAQGWADIETFIHAPAVRGLGISSHGLDVNSRWFRVTVDISVANSQLRLVSDLERIAHTRRTRVIQRRLLAPTESSSP